LILAKQTGCFSSARAPGCKFNLESTGVLMPLPDVGQIQAPASRVAVDSPLEGAYFTMTLFKFEQ